ncbi:hypothetical protein L3X37_14120 [Sabulilitoribacter arenilitoris]|uniref:Uncharacterized protein n=1 Tax=Wocania arenilitoris TaxID=2044858 RepID=A0AAE3JQS4_9FLAO|nr:hypothetical protein [Wocania arenilitoris]MCF7569485.1 hypothetical protein [Wocania arenilitoris]
MAIGIFNKTIPQVFNNSSLRLVLPNNENIKAINDMVFISVAIIMNMTPEYIRESDVLKYN